MSNKKKPLDGLFAQLQDINDGSGKLMNTVLFEERQSLRHHRDRESRSAVCHGCRSVCRLYRRAEQYRPDARRGLCPAEAGRAVPPELSPRHHRRYGVPHQELLPLLQWPTLYRDTHLPHHHAGGGQVSFVKYDPKTWLDFHTKVNKVMDILKERGIWHRKLTKDEVNEYLHRFMAFHFKDGPFSMQSFKAGDDCLKMGDKVVKSSTSSMWTRSTCPRS